MYFKSPRPDGLSDSTEAPRLYEIEDALSERLAAEFGAILSGRITTQGRREFYYYGERNDGLAESVAQVLANFEGYRFEVGFQRESDWNQYLNVLYPSDEQLQGMKNRDVLDLLERQGDDHSIVREVSHRIYFPTDSARNEFLIDATVLGYRVLNCLDCTGTLPFGVDIVRNQAVTSEAIDQAVIELFRLANRHNAEYDGWGTTAEKR